MKKGRKFAVVIMASVLMVVALLVGAVMSYYQMDTGWLVTTLPTLASVYPTYMGANAVQKNAQNKNNPAAAGGIKQQGGNK